MTVNMDGESLQLELAPADETDIGYQKCRLAVSVLERLAVPIGSFISISCDETCYICSVWPNNFVPNSTVIKLDKTVYSKLITNKTGGCFNFKSESTTCRLKPVSVSDIECVNITLVVKSIENFMNQKKSSEEDIKQKCFNCLRKKCVVENFTIDLKISRLGMMYGLCTVHIDQLKTNNSEGGIITEKSKIIINKILSEERFLLTQKSRCPEIGGVSKISSDIQDLLDLPLNHSSHFSKLGLPRPKGILLRGPPGCGKTSLVRVLAHRADAALVVINGPEILSPNPGESESNLRDLFQKALRLSQEGPCVLFIDEIDSVCPRRGKSGSSSDSRVTSTLMSAMDDLSSKESLVVVGATNRPAALDPALRRPGRFDREILMNVPSRDQRFEILKIHTKQLPLDPSVDHNLLADLTNGYVGADLAALCNEAAYRAMERENCVENKSPRVEHVDFTSALHSVVPSLQKGTEGVVDLRPVRWDDIGGLSRVKEQIRQAVEWPMLHPGAFRRLGLPPPRGVLLYGPPGCCKTTIVRAAASATRATFLSLSGAQLYSPFVGDSERLISEVFQKARAMAPTVLFLDEIDSIVGKRSEGKSSRGVQERVLSTLLNEMDGIGVRLDSKTDSPNVMKEADGQHSDQLQHQEEQQVDNNKILVVAATNRPDLVDDAILRPGRIDRIVYVPPPDEQTRLEILQIHTKKMPLEGVSLQVLAGKTNFYTGADLENLCKEAAMLSLTENLEALNVTMRHFLYGLDIVKPSLTQHLVERYRALGDKYKN